MRRNLQTEIAAYTGTLRRLRDEIESVQQARQTYTDKCEEATQVRVCRSTSLVHSACPLTPPPAYLPAYPCLDSPRRRCTSP